MNRWKTPVSPAPLALLGVTTMACACNLSEPAGSFPYRGPRIIINTTRPDMGPPDEPDAEVEVDMFMGEPELVITEVLVDTTSAQPGIGERGEFVEIKNAGTGPADPRDVTLAFIVGEATERRVQVTQPGTPDEILVVGRLKPIGPGDYFVFVRYEASDAPLRELVGEGRYYDFGRYGLSHPELENEKPVRLEVRYRGVTVDAIEWEDGELRPLNGEGAGVSYIPNQSVGVDEQNEHADFNDDVTAWCASDAAIGEGIFLGSPGSPTQCGD